MSDNSGQRYNVATNAVLYTAQLTDALYKLKELGDEVSKFSSPFADADFTGTPIKQLDAAMLNTFFSFVLPSLLANFQDTANGGRNEQIMLQMRQG